MLNPDILISPILSLDALNIAGDEKKFDVYFHPVEGPTEVGLGSYFPQTIYALEPPQFLYDHAKVQFTSISSQVDIDFEIIDDSSAADILFYYIVRLI